MIPRALALAILFAFAGGLAFLGPRLSAPIDRTALAQEMLREARYEDAASLFEDAGWRGVAEHRAGRHLRAASAFLESGESPDAIYNVGVAFAHMRDWSAAKAAFTNALRLAPAHEDARHNLAVVERAQAAEQRRQADPLSGPATEGRDGADRTGGDDPGDEEGEERASAPRGDGRPAGGTNAAQSGASRKPGEPGEKPREAGEGGGPSGGLASSEPPPLDGSAAVGSAIRRESAQAAEILLRRIRDDPDRALRARLRSAHALRRAAEAATCVDC